MTLSPTFIQVTQLSASFLETHRVQAQQMRTSATQSCHKSARHRPNDFPTCFTIFHTVECSLRVSEPNPGCQHYLRRTPAAGPGTLPLQIHAAVRYSCAGTGVCLCGDDHHLTYHQQLHSVQSWQFRRLILGATLCSAEEPHSK